MLCIAFLYMGRRKTFPNLEAFRASSLFDAKRGTKPVEPTADPEKLYTEIGRLKVELDWLKKKSGLSL